MEQQQQIRLLAITVTVDNTLDFLNDFFRIDYFRIIIFRNRIILINLHLNISEIIRLL